MDDGIASVGWSPDQESVVLLTPTGKLYLMTKDFDILQEALVEESSQAADVPVNVGWGRVETQFKGSAGKTTSGSTSASTAAGMIIRIDSCSVSQHIQSATTASLAFRGAGMVNTSSHRR